MCLLCCLDPNFAGAAERFAATLVLPPGTFDRAKQKLEILRLDESGVKSVWSEAAPEAVDLVWRDATTLAVLDFVDSGHVVRLIKDGHPAATIPVPTTSWPREWHTNDVVMSIEGTTIWLSRCEEAVSTSEGDRCTRSSWLWVDDRPHRSVRAPTGHRTRGQPLPELPKVKAPPEYTVKLDAVKHFVPNRGATPGPLVVEATSSEERRRAAVRTRGFTCEHEGRTEAWVGAGDGNMPYVNTVQWLAASPPLFAVHTTAFTPVRSLEPMTYFFQACSATQLSDLRWLGGDRWLLLSETGEGDQTISEWAFFAGSKRLGSFAGSEILAVTP